jgi:hypothetical protein
MTEAAGPAPGRIALRRIFPEPGDLFLNARMLIYPVQVYPIQGIRVLQAMPPIQRMSSDT